MHWTGVNFEVTTLPEGFTTSDAGMWFLASVNENMSFKGR